MFSIVGVVLCGGGNLGNEALKGGKALVSLKYTKPASARWCINAKKSASDCDHTMRFI